MNGYLCPIIGWVTCQPVSNRYWWLPSLKLFIRSGKSGKLSYPSLPVIPPEVRCFRCVFLGSTYLRDAFGVWVRLGLYVYLTTYKLSQNGISNFMRFRHGKNTQVVYLSSGQASKRLVDVVQSPVSWNHRGSLLVAPWRPWEARRGLWFVSRTKILAVWSLGWRLGMTGELGCFGPWHGMSWCK